MIHIDLHEKEEKETKNSFLNLVIDLKSKTNNTVMEELDDHLSQFVANNISHIRFIWQRAQMF